MLTFEAEAHRYAWNGVPVPSVTQVLEGLSNFGGVPAAVLEAAQLRGTNVHLLCQFFDEDCLDEKEFSANELNYLPAWRRFLADVRPNWTAIEQSVYHPTYAYAGTPDRLGRLESMGIEHACIDIKTSLTRSPCWGPQTAGYANAAGNPAMRRFSVQLGGDGTYRMHEWRDPQDWPVFLSALTLQRWTKANLK